jgi:hypothetical protein
VDAVDALDALDDWAALFAADEEDVSLACADTTTVETSNSRHEQVAR